MEICLNNEWGSVCDQMWDDTDAGIVCRQLGLAFHGKALFLPVRASEQGNVTGSVHIYIYIRLITRVSMKYDEIFHE